MTPSPSPPPLRDDPMCPPSAHTQRQQLRLESQWTVRALRHPLLRLLGCVAHTLATFFVCSSSPLTASLSTPARVPIYTRWFALTFAHNASWPHIAFHIALTVSLLLVLRFVAYRKLMQRTWNWHHGLTAARHALARLTSNSRSNDRATDGNAVSTSLGEHDTIELHTHASIDAAPCVTARATVLNADATAQGSWTFVACCYPFAWAATVSLLDYTLHGTALQRALLSPTGINTSGVVVQMRAQSMLFQVLMVLSVTKLLMTADLALQDTHYCRAMFHNWLVRVRRAYVTYPLLRLLSCWLALAALVVGGVYLQGFTQLQYAWLALNLGSEHAATWSQHWFSNEAWNALLAGLAVALDVLWAVQDTAFPGFATPVGVRIFGLPVELLHVNIVGGQRRPLTTLLSKWLAGFVVLGLLLPLESCHLAQLVTYAPKQYDQFVDDVSHRVRPLTLVSSSASVRSGLPANLTATEMQLLTDGAISRYFGWSVWERLPALGLVLLALGLAGWLWRAERFAVRYSTRATEPPSGLSHPRSTATQVPAATTRTITKQTRLRQLFALRAQTDSTCTVLATLSVATAVLQVRSIWRSERVVGNHDTLTSSDSGDSFAPLQAPGEAYGVLLLLLTCGLVAQLYARYRIKLQLMVLRHELPSATTTSSSCGEGAHLTLRSFPRELLAPFVLELLLCSVCLPPFVHGRLSLQETRYLLPRQTAAASLVHVSTCPSRLTLTSSSEQACDLDYAYPLEVLNMVVLARLYWFIRLPRNALLQRVVADQLLSALHRVPVESLHWSFRIAFTLAPTRLLCALFVWLWVATAAAVSIFERPFPSLLDNEEHSLWMTIVTMSSVGYGDAYPVTALGRIATFFGAVVGGVVVVSLMTSVFLDTVKGSSDELKVLSAMERVQWQQRMHHASAVLIANAWKWHRLQPTLDSAQSPSQSSLLRTAERRLFSAAFQLKSLRKRQPGAMFDSIEALKVDAVAHWRAHALPEWLDHVRAVSHAGLSELEREVDALEHAMVCVLAA